MTTSLEGYFLPWNWAISSDNWRLILQKRLELTGLATDESLSKEAKEMSALDKCFWGYGFTWSCLSHYEDDATISHNNENRNSLRPISPFKRYRQKSRASGTRKETREQGAGKESESSSVPSPLTRAFACHSKWRGYSHFLTFLGSRARSLFGEPVYVRNSGEKFELFTY